jgi:hypothetical protein
VEFFPSARATLTLALMGAALSAAVAVVSLARGIPCHPPSLALDATALAIQCGAAILLGASFALETLRQWHAALEDRRFDQMMTIALLGLAAAALAGFLVASRLPPCG